MSSDHLLKMHGVMRNTRSSNEIFFNPSTRLESATVGDSQVKAGDRVRIRPKKRADVMEVSVDQLIADVHALKPDIKVIPTSCKTGAGLDEVAETLLAV